MEEVKIYNPKSMWKADWSNPSKCGSIKIYEYDIPLPPKPSNKRIEGYGLIEKSQKFKREVIPSDLHRWDPKRLEDYVKMMYHYREHGKWVYIKGEPRYINGWAWEYYNFWTTEKGGRPDFRWEGIEFFTFFDYCWRDSDCYGMLDIKGRRMGDTDKSVYLMWAISARFRNAWSGHQNIDKDAAKENYLRVLSGHSNMPFFMKPIMKGSSDPQKVMIFDYPEEYMSKKKMLQDKKIKEEGGEVVEGNMYEPLKSRIDYETSVLGKYDGKRLAFYYLDEPGKILAFNPSAQWDIVRPALAFYNGKKIVGFGMFTTTVEAFSDGKTLANMKDMWDKSDPSDRDANNRTVTGLYRIFRDATYTGEPDEWGFPMREEAIQIINNTIAGYEKISAYDALASFKRKHPLSIEDVFTPPHDECTLFPILLDKRLSEIKNNIAPSTNEHKDLNGVEVRNKGVKGNLVWKNGIKGGDVVWQPTEVGRWTISQQPVTPNKRRIHGGRSFPGNHGVYTFGVDPVDHKVAAAIMKENKDNKVKKKSYAAGAVFRRYDDYVDNGLLRSEDGEIRHTCQMKTDTFVCDYQYRHQNPFDFYEDMLKTAIYYGVKMHCERNKPGCINYFEQQGFGGYTLAKPKALNTKNTKATNTKGTDATSNVIQMYVDLLQHHILSRIDNYNHTKILTCYRQFNTLNRTERDLTVACAYALLADIDSRKKKIDDRRTEWDKPIYKKYKR